MTKYKTDFEPLAIVGIACTLPGKVASAKEFWSLLREGRSGIKEIPHDRFSLDAYYDPNPHAMGKMSVRWGGFVEGIRDFDAEFFGISPREAEAMDPQQRMMLMAVWEAFEDAGIAAERLRGSNTSVFVGACTTDYAQIQRYRRTAENVHAGTGGAMCIIANRVSHKFDFHGPSATVDTACSSSLVATEMACNSIWHGQSDIAVSGGVNAMLDPGVFINFSKANMISRSGKIRTFDANADGFVRGEGVGALVIKRLSKAMDDGDRVYAVIRATCVNQDGYTSTISVPSAEAQIAMLGEACDRAGISYSDIDYVEAHGTGTQIGDPVEARALGTVFGKHRNRKQKLIVGAGKTNTGHLEAAAGVTGVIKTTLALYNRQIPKNLNFSKPNPNIPFDDLGIDLPLEHSEWIADNGRPRRAAVNSFGIGGTNACIVLESAPANMNGAMHPSREYRRYRMVPVSAQSTKALGTSAERYADFMTTANGSAPSMDHVAGNLSVRRSHLTFRAAALAEKPEEIISILKRAPKSIEAPSKDDTGFITGRRLVEPRIVFAFAGQGGTWWGMAHGLMKEDSIFRAAVEEIDAPFRELAGWSVAEELLRGEADYRSSTLYQLPTLFAVQVGLVARWRAWGITPSMIIGHSSGELAAAHAAGILSTPDAVKLLYHRARLQATQEGRGTIAAIALSRSDMERQLEEWGITRVDIAAVNGTSMINIAGDNDAIQEVVQKLKEKHGEDFFARVLKVDFAAHSHHMDPLREELLESLKSIRPLSGNIPMVSTVTGHLIVGQMADATYWWRNMRDAVIFENGLREVLRLGGNVFVEMGPHINLSAMISSSVAEKGTSAVVVPSLKRDEGFEKTMMTAAATLYVNGVEPRWESFHGDEVPRIDLPVYPWEKKPYWIESEESKAALQGPKAHSLLGIRELAATPMWSGEISLEEHAFLQDHKVDGSVVFPGAGYLEMMFGAGREMFGEAVDIELENVEILEAMVLSNERTELVQTTYEPARGRISISSKPRGSNLDWILRSRAIIHALPKSTHAHGRPIKAPRSAPVSPAPIYKKLSERGYAYGPSFQGMRKLWPGDHESLAYVRARDVETERFNFHPALLDAALHAGFGLKAGIGGGASSKNGKAEPERLYLPIRIERAVLRGHAGKAAFWSRARTVKFDESVAINDTIIEDEKGHRLLELEGFTCKSVGVRQKPSTSKNLKPVYLVEDWIEATPKLAESARAGRGQTWLVFRDKVAGSLAAQGARSLKEAGAHVVSVFAGDNFKASGKDGWQIDPTRVDDYAALIDAVAPQGGKKKIAGVLFGWSAAAAEALKTFDRKSVAALESRSSIAALYLVQALAKTAEQKPRVWLMTRGVHPVGESYEAKALAKAMAGAPLAGFARTALTEHADYQATVLDLDIDAKAAKRQAGNLAGVLLGKTDETEIALRGDAWFVPRLRQAEDRALPALKAPAETEELTRQYRLSMTSAGDLDNLRLIETDPLAVGAGQVKIAVKAAGLNFRDIMAATALYPTDADTNGTPSELLGVECSGVVTAVGAGVKGVRRGDKVIAFAEGCFRSELVVPASAVYDMPKRMSFVDAATVPAAYGTAYYGLVRLAHLRKGETVLVHLGTGGVGLAAIQIANLIGARVISTAGNPQKRAYLKKLGVKHVFDSRSLSFAEDVRRVTHGRGVDVVLNSLAGDAIALGVSVMAPNGRFVEIGKRDIYGDGALGLRNLRRNGAFFVLDMARMDRDDPEGIKEVFSECVDHLSRGRMKALPATVFPASRVIDAFKTMAQAKHIGKIVIDFEEEDLQVDQTTVHPFAVSPNGAYLISGGLGGFGAEAAKWLADRGAKHLYLMSRSGASRPEAKALLASLKKRAVKATAIAADVADRKQVEAVIAKISKSKRPLRGIMHSAMVLDDGLVTQLDGERMLRVIEPKAIGAWNLHEATRKAPLDFFAMFSSMASVFGSSGQANYVAANRFLDLLAAHRRRMGMPAIAINWGALGGAGAVQRDKKILRYLKESGIPPMDLSETLGGLGVMLRKDTPEIGFLKVDWATLGRANSAVKKVPRLADVMASTASGAGGGRLRGELVATKGAERERILKEFLAQQIARVLKLDAKTLEETRPLNELGLDSLTSFQLKNKIESEIGVTLPVGKFLQKPTVVSLAQTISETLDTAPAEEGKGAEKANASATRQLSPRQEWLWHRIQEDGQYPMHGMRETIAVIKIKPAIDMERLNQAFLSVVERHEMLRSAFPEVGGKPTVTVLPKEKFAVRSIDAESMPEEEFMGELHKLAHRFHDLQNGPLIDLRVFSRPDNHSVIVLRGHGILLDGWAFGMILREIFQGYFGLMPLKDSDEKPNAAYFDYARWHRNWLDGKDGKAARSYWREKLANLPAPLSLGGRDPALVDPHARGTWVKRFVAAKENWNAREVARGVGVSLHALFVGAYHAHLYGVTGARDVVIQSNVANRTRSEEEQMVGWLANEMFVRADVDPQTTLREHAANVTRALQDSMEYTGYPTHLMLEAAAETNGGPVKPHFVAFNMMWPDNMDRSGFEQIMFQAEGTLHRFGDLEITMLPVSVEGGGSYLNDAQIAYEEVDGDILISLHAREGVFDGKDGQAAYLDRFLRVLKAGLDNPDLTIGELAKIS
ncbi:MAG: SDR family NAD(P)-dependent oxidoreductase [Alphaproteobacteria bacterium]|nr:SDR family NAD(P)-dependent oxidoreductase [Alphaproteobacteria bacterium]